MLLGNYHGSAATMAPLVARCRYQRRELHHHQQRSLRRLRGQHHRHPEIVAAAAAVDTVVLAGAATAEGGDGSGLRHLPGAQSELFKAVLATGKKVVVVIRDSDAFSTCRRSRQPEKASLLQINGGPLSIDEIKGTAAAVVKPASQQSGGQAIADTLFGRNNPSGKLTTTIYPAACGRRANGGPWMDASLRPRPATNLPASEGRTHMFYTGTPLFPFGFGLRCAASVLCASALRNL